jgi:hypothetical protein
MATNPDVIVHCLSALAEAIRDVPEGPTHARMRREFLALVVELQQQQVIPTTGTWHLGSRQS